MFDRRVCLLWMLAGLALSPVAGWGAEPEPKAQATKPAADADADIDEELLEFLGSVDAEDEDWIEFLSQTDIAKVAKESADKKAAKKQDAEAAKTTVKSNE